MPAFTREPLPLMAKGIVLEGAYISTEVEHYDYFSRKRNEQVTGDRVTVWMLEAGENAPTAINVRDIKDVGWFAELTFGSPVEVECELGARDSRMTRAEIEHVFRRVKQSTSRGKGAAA